MCNHYVSPDQAELERVWHVGARDHWRGGSVFPRKLGPFVRVGAYGARETVIVRWRIGEAPNAAPLLAQNVMAREPASLR